MIHEWNVLRAFACLSIVLLHATTETILVVGDVEHELFQLSRVLLTYATPTFVLLSIIIIANKYQDTIPKGFLIKRFKYVLLPFVCFAILYALNGELNYENFQLKEKILRNVFLGDFPGWFVLAIFQLYILFWLIKKTKISTVWFLPTLFSLGLLTLTFINKTYIPDPNLRAISRMIFLTWLSYFSIGYLIGKYYNVVIKYLTKYRYVTLLLVLFAIGIVALNFYAGSISVNSRRLDIVPLVTAVTLMILAFGRVMPVSKLINFISNYGFGIYLLHRLVQFYVVPYTVHMPSIVSQITVLFIISLSISIIIIKLLSYLPFSEYLIGRVK